MSETKPPETHHDEVELVAEDDSIIGRAFKTSLIAIALLGLALCLVVWVFTRQDAESAPTEAHIAPPRFVDTPVKPPRVTFTDVTAASGIDFVHENGAVGDKLMPEAMGSGCAFIDYDADGNQDILLVNGTHWPENAPTAESPPTAALYRNDGTGHYTDVTAGSGLDVSLYGTGVAIGDYDNDGRVDVFISAVGANHLFRNITPDRTPRAGAATADSPPAKFVDVTPRAGVAGGSDAWSSSAAFIDYNNDSHLDLFVGNYIQWSRRIDFEVDYRLVGVGRAYGPPMNFQGTFPYLYRNNGDGTFTDVSADAGVQVRNPATGTPVAKSLGIAPVDVDRDGWIDLLVANDTVANFLFHNQGDGTFKESAALLGLAFDRAGNATGGMGADAGYYRKDDALGVFIGNFANEMTSAYVTQQDPTLYADESITEGIGGPSRLMLTFGLFFFDYDLDGRLDLFQANGHLEQEINVVQSSQHYEQPPQLFWNAGPDHARRFVPVADGGEPNDLLNPLVGRAAAYADIDADGDLDILVTQAGRRAVLLRNDQSTGHHWVRLTLVGRACNRDAIGALIECHVGDTPVRRRVMPTRSYLSQVELPVTVGLGSLSIVPPLTITWPDGSTQTLTDLPVDQPHAVHQSADSRGP